MRYRPSLTAAAPAVASAVAAASLCLLLSLPRPAQAQVNVYLMSSGNAAADTQVVNTLTGFGHTVTLGVQYPAFDGTQSLVGFDTVYLQTNYNWTSGNMPAAGQTALVNYVNSGGGLVTSEWYLWKIPSQGSFAILDTITPATPTGAFDSLGTATFAQSVADPVLNAGLPGSFSVPLESISGTRTSVTSTRPGATTFYTQDGGFLAVVGGQFGTGRVLNFNTVNAQIQVADPEFARLLSNSMNWTASANLVSAATPEPATVALLAVGLLPILGALAIHRTRGVVRS